MNIIYLSSCCSESKFNELREKGVIRKLPQAQKYNNLLIEGIAENIQGEIVSISASCKQTVDKADSLRKGRGIKRQNTLCIYCLFESRPFPSDNKNESGKKTDQDPLQKDHDQVIVCDILNQSLASAARSCGRKFDIPVVGIVTDVPGHTSGARRKSYSFFKRKFAAMAEKNSQRNLGKYDAYLFLTEAMNSVVNIKNKPYIVLEGHCDHRMESSENTIEGKANPKVAMYAGGIHKEFGIERLVNAFVKGEFPDWELHIYGDGNYQKDLAALVEHIHNVKYHGVMPNSVIVEQQLRATLLLNPRLTNAEYVKYSFPSKTMECMVSGTPLCTTRLPGMPQEYFPYVYFFDDETEDGMYNTLKNVLGKTSEEYHEFGRKAKAFVISEKTNLKQAKKLVDFIDTIRK